MPRYEFSEGTSNKFWEIQLEGDSFTTRWGKIGTDGQTGTKSFASEAIAKKEYEKLIAEKTKKGYELAEGGDEDGGDDSGGDGDEGGDDARNPELEKAILARPDDLQAYVVYGDWLEQQGDPRGKLIALQAQGSAQAEAASMLISDNAEHFYGEELAEKIGERVTVEWFMGFVRHARIAMDYEDTDPSMVELSRKLLTHPSGRFVQSLDFGINDSSDGENSYDDVIKLLAELAPRSLHKLVIGSFEYPDETEMSWSHMGDVSPLWKRLPGLRHLELQSGSMTLGAITAPELTHFELRTGGLTLGSIKSIVGAKWPKLETLKIWFGEENYGAEGGVEDLADLLAAKGLPRVKHLGLMNSTFARELIPVLAASKILPQLETLDLSRGALHEASALQLVTHKAAFKHLKRLDLRENTIEKIPAGLPELCADVDLGDQRENYGDDEDDRYVAVGE